MHLLGPPPPQGGGAADTVIFGAGAAADTGVEKPKLAIICTVWYYLTHGQHEGDRFNHGYPMHGKWHDPEVELVSICAKGACTAGVSCAPHALRADGARARTADMRAPCTTSFRLLPSAPCIGPGPLFRANVCSLLWIHLNTDLMQLPTGCTDVDQKSKTDTHGTDPNDPDNEYTGDLTWRREQEFEQLRVYDTIAGALRCGGDRLAVDAVLIIGEHGDYETDEYQMTHWPRYEFFSEVVNVFKEDGRALPIFSDKHLSWNWHKAKEMVAIS